MKYFFMAVVACLMLQACSVRMPDAPNAVPQGNIGLVQGV